MYFVSFFFLLLLKHARWQHPRWYPGDPFILIAENGLRDPAPATLLHHAVTLPAKPDSRAGKEVPDVPCSVLWDGGSAPPVPSLIPGVFSFSPPCALLPFLGLLRAFIPQEAIFRTKRIRYGGVCTFLPLTPFLQPWTNTNMNNEVSPERESHSSFPACFSMPLSPSVLKYLVGSFQSHP